MRIAVASGKGGTDNTSFVAEFAHLSGETVVLGDCVVVACEGCCACSVVCPKEAVGFVENRSGGGQGQRPRWRHGWRYG